MSVTKVEQLKKPQGSKFTPKKDMHIGRDWSPASWKQAFRAAAKRWANSSHTATKG